MANPYLPMWEHIPDGEPRVFGDRIYIYGSHDNADTDEFCDFCLKVWSAPVSDPENWTSHGIAFATRDFPGHPSDTDWTDGRLFAPDVVEKDGKYYLYAYIQNAPGCVAVSDKPEGPFKLLSRYKHNIENHPDGGIFIDPGTLVDDDGRVYVYCGFLRSYMFEVNPDNMYEVIDGTFKRDIIPNTPPFNFFEACSPRKINGKYYMIYSSAEPSSQLVYAVSDSPTGPFEYKGTLIDSGCNYPGGNDHGSVAKIGDDWYVFYHKMTNGSIMSRVGCVDKIEFTADGDFLQAEMTSLGFEDVLNPYRVTNPQMACVLTNDATITERTPFDQCITKISDGAVLGFKYYDFGEHSDSEMKCVIKLSNCYMSGKIHIFADGVPQEAIEKYARPIYPDEPNAEEKKAKRQDTSAKCYGFSGKLLEEFCKPEYTGRFGLSHEGKEIGCAEFSSNAGIVSATVDGLSGKHAIYFLIEGKYKGWGGHYMDGRNLFDFYGFVFQI